MAESPEQPPHPAVEAPAGHAGPIHLPHRSSPPKPLPEVVRELWELIVAYFKQETLVPIQQLGRYVGFGVLGALLLGVAVVCFTMGILRALELETGDTFTGDYTWVPYLITAAIVGVGGFVVWAVRGSGRNAKEAGE